MTPRPSSSELSCHLEVCDSSRKPDQSVKLKVYRKSTHTDQYLAFDSHHPIQHKLGVVRTLLDRCQNIVTEEVDQKEEREHIEKALTVCGYPKWTFRKVEKQMQEKKEGKTKEKKDKEPDEKSKGMIVLPYVKGVTEQLKRVFSKHKIATSIKPYQTLRNILVHPKDKIETENKTGVVYKVVCKNCPRVYIGETGRKLGTRTKEHRTEVNELPSMSQTRAARKESTSTRHRSAICDHVHQNNHVIDWGEVTTIDREDN